MKCIFDDLEAEIFGQDIGYKTRVNGLVDELLVVSARALKVQTDKAYKDMGQTSLYNFVKQETGFSPHQYLLHLRVETAQSYLKKGEITITDIAIECGFYSSQHFANVFKARTGFTPREYRKLLLNC